MAKERHLNTEPYTDLEAYIELMDDPHLTQLLDYYITNRLSIKVKSVHYGNIPGRTDYDTVKVGLFLNDKLISQDEVRI